MFIVCEFNIIIALLFKNIRRKLVFQKNNYFYAPRKIYSKVMVFFYLLD